MGEERIDSLRDEIERSLSFSSEVLPLDRAAYLGPELSPAEGERVDCDAWRQSGADAVVVGQVRREAAKMRADLRVVDVARCADLETGNVLADRDERAPLPADAEPAVRARLGAVLDAMPAWDPPAKARR